MSATDALENLLPSEGQGQPPAASEAGNSQPDPLAIGAYNEITAPNKEVKPPPSLPMQQGTQTQPISKDERHASRKITELSEQRINFARLAVEHSEEAIYDIAKSDPDLAQKLLGEYDYGTENLEELLALKANPKADPDEVQRQVQNDQRIRELENRVLDETIKRLKRDHPDLKDELEDTFRTMYSDQNFAQYDETKKMEIARAMLGVKPPQQEKQQVSQKTLLDILKTQEASTTSLPSTVNLEKTYSIPEGKRDIYASAGVTPDKMKKFLPDNIDEVVERIYSHSVKK